MGEDDDAAGLTVGRAAMRLGVTVRALHHWDEIALASASMRSASGYRLYTETDLERLRRVVAYREVGLELEAIRSILDDPVADVVTSLREQRAQLSARIARLTALGHDLDRMIEAHEHGAVLSAEEQRAVFGEEWNTDWPAEAARRYGDTHEWRSYAERTAVRTTADWQAIMQENTELERALAAAMDAGVKPGGEEADALVEEHRAVFSQYFPITRQMQVVLGRMYESEPGFSAHYERVAPGLASWLRRIIDASARSRGIDPDAANWG